MLDSYSQMVFRFIRDANMDLMNPMNVRTYINRARREIAMRTQCVRVLTPSSGQILTTNVVNPGSNYTNPTVVITPPDFPSGTLPYPNGKQATGIATVSAGTISAVNIEFGGSGYFQPQITITDPTGTGASITPNLSFINLLNLGQEVYPFSGINMSEFPGVGSPFMVKSLSVVYSNYRYSLPVYSFSTYQARIRQYPFQYQYVPTMASQYGQGTNGSFYVYPLPSQAYQFELDCFCLPSDLIDDSSIEAIPGPWTDGVPFYAAFLAFTELQNFNSARMMLELFDRELRIYSTSARPGRASNPLGRW